MKKNSTLLSLLCSLFLFSNNVNAQDVSKLQSYPQGDGVVFIDFNGRDHVPNPNVPISTQYLYWKQVSQIFRTTTLNITTDEAVFNSFPNNRKTVCVVGTSVQGIAVGHSFGSNDVPNTYIRYDGNHRYMIAQFAHEIGHTLGLAHKGQWVSGQYKDYYLGHGIWAPIMGNANATSEKLFQWSKGEYTNANNPGDDLKVINRLYNGISFRADDRTNSFHGAPTLNTNGTTVLDSGVIETRFDVDAFYFKTTGGTIDLNLTPNQEWKQIDVKAWIEDAQGNTLQTSAPTQNANARIQLSLVAGEYVIKIDGDGDNSSNGHSDYGSIGKYEINGTINGFINSTSPTNSLPKVVSTSLNIIEDTLIWDGENITLTPSTVDTDGSIASILYYENDSLIGSGQSLIWDPVFPGYKEVLIIVTDDKGASIEKRVKMYVVHSKLSKLTQSSLAIHDFSSEEVGNPPFSPPSKASFTIDGNKKSAWWSKQRDINNLHFITYNLGTTKKIGAIETDYASTLNWARAETMSIAVSLDGTNWDELRSNIILKGNEEKNILLVQPQNAKYVRLSFGSSFGGVNDLTVPEVNLFAYKDITLHTTTSQNTSSLQYIPSGDFYSIHNTQGQLILSGNAEKDILPIELLNKIQLPKSIYIISIYNKDGKSSIKINN